MLRVLAVSFLVAVVMGTTVYVALQTMMALLSGMGAGLLQ